jgi:hypothetical protein
LLACRLASRTLSSETGMMTVRMKQLGPHLGRLGVPAAVVYVFYRFMHTIPR